MMRRRNLEAPLSDIASTRGLQPIWVLVVSTCRAGSHGTGVTSAYRSSESSLISAGHVDKGICWLGAAAGGLTIFSPPLFAWRHMPGRTNCRQYIIRPFQHRTAPPARRQRLAQAEKTERVSTVPRSFGSRGRVRRRADAATAMA